MCCIMYSYCMCLLCMILLDVNSSPSHGDGDGIGIVIGVVMGVVGLLLVIIGVLLLLYCTRRLHSKQANLVSTKTTNLNANYITMQPNPCYDAIDKTTENLNGSITAYPESPDPQPYLELIALTQPSSPVVMNTNQSYKQDETKTDVFMQHNPSYVAKVIDTTTENSNLIPNPSCDVLSTRTQDTCLYVEPIGLIRPSDSVVMDTNPSYGQTANQDGIESDSVITDQHDYDYIKDDSSDVMNTVVEQEHDVQNHVDINQRLNDKNFNPPYSVAKDIINQSQCEDSRSAPSMPDDDTDVTDTQ